ncbi:MAG: YdcF family protein [Anaerolineaceae bacterium]|nr:YdcF family protein [Anaerolineaceae bacterium]
MSATRHTLPGWGKLILGLVVLAVLFVPVMRALGNFLVVSDVPQKVDLITASSGPEYRILYAAQLFQRSYGKMLFFTGGYNEFDNRYEAGWSRTLATQQGVPPEDIYTDDTTVTSTYEEAKRLKAFIDAHPGEIQSVMIVTDMYHTRRAQWTYRKVLGDGITLVMAPVPYAQAGYTKDWWLNSFSRELVLKEYAKYAFYLLRYQYSSGPLQRFLAKFDKW